MERKQPKNFKCEERLCTKAFRTGNGLREHVKAVHWQAGGSDHAAAGLRTSMKAKKIDKSAINLLPLATLPYNMKVEITKLIQQYCTKCVRSFMRHAIIRNIGYHFINGGG